MPGGKVGPRRARSYATIRDEHGIRYINCGDWVESCTAVVEHDDGHFEIINWSGAWPYADRDRW